MLRLTTPISDEKIRSLHVGDSVLLNGIIVTGRDAAHKFLIEHYIRNQSDDPEDVALLEKLKALLNGGVIYHCGPVVKKNDDGSWSFVAAGPTTSIREEVYESEVIKFFNLKGVIGKGGMAGKTLQACQEQPAVYFHAIGGAATLIAQSVKEVVDVYKLDFGVPEAMWVIRVEDFPVVVTMDSHGQSIHDKVLAESEDRFRQLVG
ncbi:MAG: fumarate hydrolyase [Clostridia bacterium]|nr:MAG: fumarate hydrolyase [Clostridia bacterium]